MTSYIALLRAVNVGGTGSIPMTELKRLCSDAGFAGVQTYIASGNVVFGSKASEAKVKATLEKCLEGRAGKPVGVLVRTGAEMAAVLKANPFPKAPANLVHAIFLDQAPPKDAISNAVGLQDEQLRPGAREIYVYYPLGAGQSRLRIPAAKSGTARNMNTVARLAAMAAERDPQAARGRQA